MLFGVREGLAWRGKGSGGVQGLRLRGGVGARVSGTEQISPYSTQTRALVAGEGWGGRRGWMAVPNKKGEGWGLVGCWKGRCVIFRKLEG